MTHHPPALSDPPAGYADWLVELKTRIHVAQQRAALAVNRELVLLYWQIGRDILARQANQGWGAKVIDRLAHDLRTAFPEMKGFSPRNLKYMRAFAEAWQDDEFVQATLAQLPWYHHLALLDKLKTEKERRWYAAKAIEHNWSRNVLVMQIETRLRERTGAAVTNFTAQLPAPQSDLARESLKDPYRLDFLGLGKDAEERAIETALIQHITQFLIELGAGFAFVGRQVHIEVGGDDFFIDLLFYHLKLRCYVVVELKAGPFKPEHTGQLNFYLSVVDAEIKHPDDNSTIGLLLCKSQNRVVAEYALRGINKPIGVAEYQLINALPAELRTSLPSIDDIERELSDVNGEHRVSRRLTALRVGNFKAFADTQRIPLKPITLIFGPNSAGKSSFIHSLALAHEAQFGRDKRSLARLDVHHTEIGGSSIDLGGFRQYVHRGQANRRVEWGAELTVANLSGRLAQLLAPVNTITVTLSLGIELDDQDRPKLSAEPRVEAIDISADNAELLHMSHRRSDTYGSLLRLDRLDSAHPVFRQVLKAIVESATTSEEMRPEDFDGANAAIADLLPELQVRIEQFFPTVVELPKAEGAELSPVSLLFPISKGNRREDIAQAVRFYLPRTINDLVKGLSDVLADELKRLQYLGPLRSFPPRHLAFAEYEDANWYAGGGYAWDVVRRDDQVREVVNSWLGSSKLQTRYKLVVRSLAAVDQLQEPIANALETIPTDALGLKAKFFDEQEPVSVDDGTYLTRPDISHLVESIYPEIRDTEVAAEHLVRALDGSNLEALRELVLIDQRTHTVVTHRDVGIGISQVLPVLVMAYGSQGKLIAMEQPEVHLHPALQAELGDVFIEAALGERQNTFILETHSEHLILRLMRRMRETYLHKDTGLPPVTPADVSILYVEPDGPRSIVREMLLNELGELVKSWPGGFFEESLREQFGDA